MDLRWIICVFVACLGVKAAAQNDTLTLSGATSDHAVIPRYAPIDFRGTAAPGSDVHVAFAGQLKVASADTDGSWHVQFDPLDAGGPYALSVSSGDAQIEISDLMVGDVWLCSGQSNMEYPLYRALNPDSEIAGPHSARIRLFQVPNTMQLAPVATFPAGAQWQIASPQTVGGFSAVCYLTAKQLEQELQVPIGLIDASWGGSQIEAWLSQPSLRRVGGADEALTILDLYRQDPARGAQAYGRIWQDWWQAGVGSQPWLQSTPSESASIVPGPMRDWNTYGDPHLAGFSGRVWFTRTFELTDAQAMSDARLSLGVIDERDLTWINGDLIGATDSWSESRLYSVPGDTLKPGRNTVIVMVENAYGAGGMIGPDDEMYLDLGSDEAIALASGWSYEIAANAGPAPSPPWSATGGYSTIYNAMVAPLGSLPLSGVLWYQGESNTGRGGQYETLLRALVDQWRGQFGEYVPVLIVQLPGYGAMPDAPRPSGWSDVREAQRQVARSDAQTGLVVAIDAGDRTDIHPPNKQLVADRAFDVYLALTGRSDGYADGIAPVSVERSGNAIKLVMPTDQLRPISHADPIGFQLCDADGDGDGDCKWAQAELSGFEILVSAEGLEAPERVRYCWGDAPICNLYDTKNMPVVPFQEQID